MSKPLTAIDAALAAATTIHGRPHPSEAYPAVIADLRRRAAELNRVADLLEEVRHVAA